MMKWGRGKPSSPSPSRDSSISHHVFPMSWLSKFKQKGNNSEPKPTKAKPNLACQSMPTPTSLKDGRFYGGDDDDFYWRLSFGEDRVEGEKSKWGLQSDRYHSDNEMAAVSDTRKSRELTRNVLPEIVTCNEVEKERGSEEFEVVRRKAVKDQKLRKTKFEALNLKQIDGLSETKLSSELQQLTEMNIKRLMSMSEKQRKSVYISRKLQRRTKKSGRVRVYSPRMVAKIECKVKALEDMKKAKMKMKKMTKEKAVQQRTAFDSFAVVKSSFDPQKDFRNSMIEMITAKGIWRPEELEELLACYLTLNTDKYHDLIIKVFKQVWVDLNLKHFGSERQNEHHFSMINHFLS
ncbi:hypothetical protein CsSME_00031687 [Camellia sinensis var. sinensis]